MPDSTTRECPHHMAGCRRRRCVRAEQATASEELEYARRLLVFADGIAVANTDFALADLYAEDCAWAQETLRSAGCHPRGVIPRLRGLDA